MGTVPASAGWNINWFIEPPQVTDPTTGTQVNDPFAYCPDQYKSLKIPILDASHYDGLSIQLFGSKPGPTGQMTLTIDSVGTPEDPTRYQELQTVINILDTPTTYNFKWSDLTAACGNWNDFQPGRIVGVAAQVLALAGIAYEYDVVIGKIGFIPKTQ